MANSNGWGDGAANNAIGWGQGANNNIGWGDSHAKSWAGLTDIVGLTTDTDAQAFITAAAITDATQKSAIDTLVKGMKADGIWTKMKAIYPFVGGTATTHKYNLKDPRDLDAAFRLVFNGGWTHSSTGATPNGTNGYADTKLVPSSVLSVGNSSYSYYTRTDKSAAVGVAFGCTSNAITNIPLIQNYLRFTTGNYLLDVGDFTNRASATNAVTKGMYVNTRTSSSSLKAFKNNTLLASNLTLDTSSTLPSVSLYLAGFNNNGTASAYDVINYAFTSIADGLTDTEAANLYTRVQAFQTALSRQV